MFEDVVVPWDGSDRSREALRWVLARPDVVTATLVRVLPDTEAGHDIEVGSRLLLEAEAERSSRLHPGTTVDARMVHGDVEDAVLLEAVPGRTLVLGTGGAAAFALPRRSAMLSRIARHAEGPVALVPIDGGGDPLGPVLAGVDGTAAGVAAAQIAAAEAAAAGRSVVAMHVHPGGAVPPGWPADPLDGCARELESHFPHLLVRQRVVRGDIRQQLLQASAQASLLVLGRHALPGAAAGLQQDALAGAVCPVLLVRETDALWTTDAGVVASGAGG